MIANNGREAVEALERKSFDLLLTDIQMPEMDGFEATRAIREKEKATGGHIPIYAMTANLMKDELDLCHEVGMDGYVSKPIQRPVLREVLDSVVAYKSTGTQMEITTEQKPKPAPSIAVSEVIDTAKLVESLGGDIELVREVVGPVSGAGLPQTVAGIARGNFMR